MQVTAIFVLVLGPLAAVLVALVVSGRASAWHPASDVAVEILRISEVGGRHTPLVGVHSRYGWDHPGPVLFWALAPFSWLFGAAGVLVGVVVLNAVAVAGALVLARRRGDTPLMVLVGVVALALCYALGPDLLADPWNPWVAVLPFLAFVLLVWSLADGEVVMLPWLVGTGTVLVQTHVGYSPFVLGLGVLGGAMAWWSSRRRGEHGPEQRATARRSAVLAAVVGGLLWLPPIAQQLFGADGNLAAIVRYFRDPSERAVGWRISWGIMGTELGFPGAWLAGNEIDAFGVRTSSTWPGVALLAATVVLGFLAWRRGVRSAGRLAVLAVSVAGLGVVAGSRVTGLVGSYLVRWWWVIAAVVWLSVLWSGWSLLVGARVRAVVAVVSVGALVVLSAVMIGRAVSVEVPNAQDSVVIGRLSSQIMAALDDDASSFVVDWTDARDWGAVGSGVFVDLERRGLSVAAAARHDATFGTWRTASPQERDGLIVVMAADELERGVAPPPEAGAVADYDPLTPTQRARTEELLGQVGDELGERQLGLVAHRHPVRPPGTERPRRPTGARRRAG